MRIGLSLAHDYFRLRNLDRVRTFMLTLGPPVIIAHPTPDPTIWAALEGCHRLRSAHALGLSPVIRPYDPERDHTERYWLGLKYNRRFLEHYRRRLILWFDGVTILRDPPP